MAGIIGNIYERLALLSPRLEVKLRQLYWKHSSQLRQYAPNHQVASQEEEQEKVDFENILALLREWGVKEGSLLIVHSSYDSLRCTGLSPQEIIDKLLGLVGKSGTLAMPVIRRYKEEPPVAEKLTADLSQIECKYHVKRTPVITGLLPSMLMRCTDAVISKHPLNPLCAVGPLAEQMMTHNLEGDKPSPHGANSSWKFCLDHGALVCGLGTDLRHHNTMGHVAEEAFGNWHWSDDEWYNIRNFVVEAPGDEPIKVQVKERKPKWGMLHQAELNRYHDFLNNGVLKSKKIGNVLVEFEEAQKLISFLQSKNRNGYPYFE